MALLTYVLALCAVACPVLMIGMMWFMRGHGRGSPAPPGQEGGQE